MKSKSPILRNICIGSLILFFIILYIPAEFEKRDMEFNYLIYWIIESILILAVFVSYGYLNKNGYQFIATIDLEKIPDDFNMVYQDIYKKYNEKIKSARGNLGNVEIASWTCYALTIICFFGFMVISQHLHYQDVVQAIFVILAIALFFVANTIVVVRRKRLDKFRNYYKSMCIPDILKLINPNIEYKPVSSDKTKERLINVFNECKCYQRSARKIYAEDSMFLEKNNLSIEFADTKFTAHGKNTVIFDGLFCNTTLNYYFKKHIRIRTESIESYIDLPIIKLDSDEFEQYFEVQSEDNIYAVRMLTADIMEEFVKFYKKIQLKFEVNIYKDMLTIKFHTGPMFEPKLLGEAIDKEALYAYYEIVKFAEDTVMKINKILEEFN
ncbi:MAG: DUF3137 domain-containing protein [Clostridia bacterium]|nr:DUF3137 domain-containing protein [Clostridia bacterium]